MIEVTLQSLLQLAVRLLLMIGNYVVVYYLYNLYIPSLHDELAHPRIWIDRHANIDNVVMPILVQCGTNVGSIISPFWSVCPFQYHYSPFWYLFGPFRCLRSFSMLIQFFSVPFGSFRFLSALFCVYSYR